MPRRRRTTPKPPVETITLQIPLTGKPFETIWDVVEAFHSLPQAAEEYLSSYEDNLPEMDVNDKLQLLIFLHRLMAWNASEHLASLAGFVRDSLGSVGDID